MQMRAAVPVLLAVLAAGCHVSTSQLGGRAADEWVRSYTIAPGGEIAVTSTNGAIEVEGYDGPTVEVRAERSVRAVNDQAAKELLSRVTIHEEIAPDRVAIRTEGIGGILIGVSYQVTYRVRAPHAVVPRIRATNGSITARRFDGHLVATSTNGGIVGEDLGGTLEARGTNGNVSVGFRAIGSQGIVVRTTNGRIELVLPESAGARLSAACRNGSISVDGLPFQAEGDQSRR
jgi:hypothetical protein